MEGYGGGSDDMSLRERASEGMGGVQSGVVLLYVESVVLSVYCVALHDCMGAY